MLQGVYDRAAVHAVLHAAFQAGFGDVEAVLAFDGVEDPVAVFAVIDVIAHAVGIVVLVGVGAGEGNFEFGELFFGAACRPFCENFFEAGFVLASLVLLVKNAVFLVVEIYAAKAIFQRFAVIAILAFGAIHAVLDVVTVVAAD